VVQVVRSDAFAGVERYISDVANELILRDWDVVVIGGEPTRMREALNPQIRHISAVTTMEVARQLWGLGSSTIVHAHMTAAEVPAALLKGRLRADLVTTQHFASARASSWIGRMALRLTSARTDTAISISEFVATTVGRPTVVVPNGTSPSLRKLSRTRTVLMMQRLAVEKDVATGIRAWAQSGLAEADWKLKIFGRGVMEHDLKQLCEQLGVADSVTFAGFTDQPREVLARAGLLLATAPAEPFGLTVLESMAEGTAVVAASGGAHREILGQNGRYFAPGNVLECAQQLRALAVDDVMRVNLGEQLQSRQQQLYSISTHVDVLEAIYQL
jgi:glycosyltransferase involved in cell wall biosynthesis